MKANTELKFKIRLNALDSTETEMSWKEGDSLQDIFDAVAQEHELPIDVHEFFGIFLDGYSIDRELWFSTRPKPTSTILVGILPKGGSGRSIFRQVIVLAAVVAVTIATSGQAPWIIALAAGSTGIVATLAVNALLPDPMPSLGDLGQNLPDDLESSQMYVINSQSNKVSKYGGVPRVYGRHKYFPTIAANPYTDIVADNETKELVQFFYAIYDFGVGPLKVEDIKIGGTRLSDFADLDYRLVDPNKPSYAPAEVEPDWDSQLATTFTIYKGDGDQENTNVAINGNLSEGADVDEYQVVRAVPGEFQGNLQEVVVTFVAPRGLDTLGTDGSHAERFIDLTVEFAKTGTTNWKNFRDLQYVSSFDITGCEALNTSFHGMMRPASFQYVAGNPPAGYFENYPTRYTTSFTQAYTFTGYHPAENVPTYGWVTTYYYYYTAYLPKGHKTIPATSGQGLSRRIVVNGEDLGYATAETPLGNGYSNYTVTVGLSKEWVLYTATYKQVGFATTPFIFETSYASRPAYFYTASAGDITLKGNSNKPVYAVIRFKPREASNFKVRIKRLRSYGGYTFQVSDELTVSSIGSRFDRDPIKTKLRHTFLELKIRSTNQLSGAIQNLSGIVSSVVDIYDKNTQTWSLGYSSNPAWIFTDLLIGPMNKKPLSKDKLDLASIVEWSEFCDATPEQPPSNPNQWVGPRFKCDFILDFKTTLQQILNKIGHSCQASLNVYDGKYGVLIDKYKDTPVQIFTNRNSWDFSSSRTYREPTQALKIKYVDSETWSPNETIVYGTGYNFDNTLEFDDLTIFACVDSLQAWRVGRFLLAESLLRQEVISIKVDFEHLVCTRGDYVKIAQDVMKVGGVPARVISVVGTTIHIDNKFEVAPATNYGYTYRPGNGNITTSTLTVLTPSSATVDGPIPEVGDLIIWGAVGQITFDCLVKAISPGGDFTATLTLVEKADAIYDSEASDELPSYNPFLNTVVDTDVLAPRPVTDLTVVDNYYECNGYTYEYFIDLSWVLPSGSVFELFEIYVNVGEGFKLFDSASSLIFTYTVNPENLGVEHSFKVIAVSSNGNKISLGEAETVSATPLAKVAPPSNVEALYLNVTGETIQIDWPPVTDCDILEYLIRFSPVLDGTWEQSIPLQRVDRKTTLATSQARTGTYLIKAIDFNGNESNDAALAITSIPELFGLNLIEETNDFPALLGSTYQVDKSQGYLILKEKVLGGVGTGEYYSEGEYYFSSFLDLGDIYIARLQSQIRAEGFTKGDIMSTWATLSDVLALSNSRFSEWDVETYYRSTENYNTMSEWTSMSAIDPISEGVQDNWTPWRKFTMGDFSGRIFQFKLKLLSYKASVTPRVFDGIIRIDMPDRRDIFNNVISNIGVTTITYQYPFKGPGTSPVIAITIDNASVGDYYIISNKTLSSFDIVFYDVTNAQVSRQFDASAQGYGRRTGTIL